MPTKVNKNAAQKSDVFLSHNSAESKLVKHIDIRLRRKYQIRSWLDSRYLIGGEEWYKELFHALESCGKCVVFLGEHGWSKYHKLEVEYVLELEKKDANYLIIPVLLPGAKETDQNQYPEIFKRKQYIDFRKGVDDDDAYARLASAIRREPPYPHGTPEMSLAIILEESERWKVSGDNSILFSGGELRAAEKIAQEDSDQLGDVAREFLDISIKIERRKRQTLIVSLTAVLLILIALVFFAWSQTNARSESDALARQQAVQRVTAEAEAKRQASQRETADANAQLEAAQKATAAAAAFTAEANAISQANGRATAEADTEMQVKRRKSYRLLTESISNYEKQIDLALLLGIEAVNLDNNSQARNNLLAILASHPYLIAYLRGHKDIVDTLTFSPDGKILASGGTEDGTVILWDTATHNRIGQLHEEESGIVLDLAFSSDSRTLVSKWFPDIIILWDVTTQKPIAQPLKRDGMGGFALSPNGKILALMTNQGLILFDVPTLQQIGQPLMSPVGHSSVIRFSPDGKTLAATDGKSITLWDATVNQQVGELLTTHKDDITHLVFDPASKILVSVSSDSVMLWDLTTRQSIGELFASSTSDILSVAFSPNGKVLALGRFGEVGLWDVATRSLITTPLWGDSLLGRGNMAFSPDLKTLAAGSVDYTIGLWNLEEQQNLVQKLTSTENIVESFAFSPDNKIIAWGNDDGSIVLWDREAQKVTDILLNEPRGAIHQLAFSPDNSILAVDHEGTLRLWDMSTRKPILHRAITGSSFVFRSDGKVLAFATATEVVLLDVAKQESIQHMPTGDDGPVFSVAFNSDGKTLAAGTEKSILQWDLTTNQRAKLFEVPLTYSVPALTFSPDGKMLAASVCSTGKCYRNPIYLWYSTTQVPLGRLYVDATRGWPSLAFSPDSAILAAGSRNGKIDLWDMATHKQIGKPLRGPEVSLFNLAYGPDGKVLAGSGCAYEKGYRSCGEGAIFLWDMELENWKALACQIANRNLTRIEWVQYSNPDPSTYDTIYAMKPTCKDFPLES